MRIVSVRLGGFRNLAEAALDFSPRVNLLSGGNGEGKTNLLEALDWLALGRSHRGARNEDLIAFDRDDLHVALELEEDGGARLRGEFGLDRGGGPTWWAGWPRSSSTPTASAWCRAGPSGGASSPTRAWPRSTPPIWST
jgi:hypothetical protein